MSIEMIEGWQVNYDEAAVIASGKYFSTANTFLMIDGESRTFRGRSLRCDRQDGANNPKFTYPLSGFLGEIVVGFAVKWQGDCRDYLGGGIPFLTFTNGVSGVQSTFEWAATNNADEFTGAFVDNNGTRYFFDSNFEVNTWHYFEIKVSFAGGGGIWELRMNQTIVEAGVGNTGPAGSIDSVSFNCIAGGSGAANHALLTDIYICNTNGTLNNDFLGNVGIEPIILVNDEQAEWGVNPPTASANYTAVDDDVISPDNDATYVFTQSNGNIDLYGIQTMQTLQSTINAVTWAADARIAGAAGNRNIRPRYRVGGSNGSGSTFTITNASYETFQETIETDPTTGSGWTLGNLNNLKIGVESL